MWMLFFPFVPQSPSHTVSTSPSLHLCLLPFPSDRFINIIFLDYIYIYIYVHVCVNILYLFFWLTSLCIAGCRFTKTDWNSFFFINEQYYIYPFISWWTSRLLPRPHYCKLCCEEHWGASVFFDNFFSEYMPNGTVAGSYGRVTPSFLRSLHSGWSR